MFGPNVQPAKLASPGQTIQVGSMATVIGWGITEVGYIVYEPSRVHIVVYNLDKNFEFKSCAIIKIRI